MLPLGVSGGDQDRVAVVAVILVTMMSSGGDSGARADPEPEKKSPTTHTMMEERRRDTNIVTTLSLQQHYMDYQWRTARLQPDYRASYRLYRRWLQRLETV